MQMICFTSPLKEPKGSKHELCEKGTCICANRGFFVVYPRYFDFLGVNPGDKTLWNTLGNPSDLENLSLTKYALPLPWVYPVHYIYIHGLDWGAMA